MTFGVNFGVEVLSTLFVCTESPPLYYQHTVATENKLNRILLVLGECEQYVARFWLPRDAFHIHIYNFLKLILAYSFVTKNNWVLAFHGPSIRARISELVSNSSMMLGCVCCCMCLLLLL